ncbi:MAG: inositol monophosphatase [Oscillospiraceae bacterium]|nr:inositol monophosphatase [Oscillospiraceae bacterium]
MYRAMEEIVRQAGELLLSAHDIETSVKVKTLACDLVTVYDKAVQDYLCKELLAAYPDAGIYAEEEDLCDIDGKTRYFIIDPIDGTANFVRQLHHSCISVGLYEEGKIIAAVVYNPYAREMFTAALGQGAYLNGQRLHMTQVDLDHSLVLFGSAIYYRETVPATIRLVEELLPRVLDFRRGGSAALDLCYLAAGKADLFFEACLRPWDYAAGSLMVTEAGGIVTALDGSTLRFYDRCSVAAGSNINHPTLIQIAQAIGQEPTMKGRIS